MSFTDRTVQLFALLVTFAFTVPTGGTQAEGTEQVARREGWTTSRLAGTPTPPEPYRVVSAFPDLKFDHPTSISELPGTGRLLITQMNGGVFTFPKDAAVASADLAVDLSSVAGSGVSLFSITAHPKFAQNGFVFACLVHPGGNGIDGSHTRVSRFQMSHDRPPRIDPTSETIIITWPSGGHNAGCLRFGPDGLLYISTGDGSGPNPPDGLTTGQTVDDLLGAILRIDVDRTDDGKNYAIPAGNPFIDRPDARAEIFGYGLRNPWKFDIDSQSGDVFVADNGWETWEMVHLVRSGTNCGWPVMEGRVALRSEVPTGPTPITPPIRDHHHSEANSVIGGPVYRGNALSELTGQFIYGDYITGTIWSAWRDTGGAFTGRTLVDTDLRIVDFTQGSKGEIYVLDYDLSGQVFQLLPNDAEDLSADFPRRLSETGLLAPGSGLAPATGVFAYEVIVPRWMDGATAQRWVAVPGTQSIELGTWGSVQSKFPNGTVFAKHLSIPAVGNQTSRLLETQVLLYWNGVWNPLSYLWNEQGTDAELVGPVGASQMVRWPDPHVADGFAERTWRTSAINECRLCHNAGPGFVLGLTAEQLAGPRHSGRTASSSVADSTELRSLIAAGVVRHGTLGQVAQPPARLVNPADDALDLNDRARSYLHGNCGMCHHRGGNAIVSFFLTRDLTFEQMNTNKGTNIGTFGMSDAKIIVPGDPYRSVLFYRMSKLGYVRMPYIGSHVVDSAGVSLIEKWIRSLPRNGSASVSAPLTADSGEQQALGLLNGEASPDARRDAVALLVGSTEGSLALAAEFHGGRLSAEDRTAATEAARNAPSDIRGLFDQFLPESARKKTLGSGFDPQLVLALEGDVLRGRLIFFSDAARCRTCHHQEDVAQSVGPTLAEIGKKYVHNSEMLQHVLNPSLKIEDKFAAWIVILNDGRVMNGLMEKESPQNIQLRTADRRSVSLPRSEIDELQKSTRSLMPENVLADLTAQEAADLLAFIRSATQVER